MTKLANHQSGQITKMLVLGDTGSGKTGALASLADAGYNLRIIDLDNGVDALANLLNDPKTPYDKRAIERVDYETLTDKMRAVGGKLMPKAATVFQRATALLDNWKTESSNLGPVSSWGPRDVLVIDSLTFLSKAALDMVQAMNARLGSKPFQSDYGDAQDMIERLCQMLYDDGVNCNVIVNTHIMYIGENGIERGYPSCVGKALPPKIGRYFNSMIMAKSQGSGAAAKHKFVTVSQPQIELKNSAPLRVKPEYPIETGLAEFFRDVQGRTETKLPPEPAPSNTPVTG